MSRILDKDPVRIGLRGNLRYNLCREKQENLSEQDLTKLPSIRGETDEPI